MTKSVRLEGRGYVLDAEGTVHVRAGGVASNYHPWYGPPSPFRCGRAVSGTTLEVSADGPSCIWCAVDKPFQAAVTGMTAMTYAASAMPVQRFATSMPYTVTGTTWRP